MGHPIHVWAIFFGPYMYGQPIQVWVPIQVWLPYMHMEQLWCVGVWYTGVMVYCDRQLQGYALQNDAAFGFSGTRTISIL